MNVYKPLMIFNLSQSIRILADGCANFRKVLVEGAKPNLKKIKELRGRIAHAGDSGLASDRL
jgi:fumarate hydratase class II